jgi:hypothetical protein
MVIVSFLLMSALAQQPGTVIKAEIEETGIYAWSRERGSVSVSGNSTNPLIFSGGSIAKTLQLGTKVPLVQGLSFGLKFSIPLPEGRYTMLWQVEHPPMTTPDGRVSSGYQEDREIYVVPELYDIKVYTFDHPYEMVEGRWVFRYIYQGQTVLEQAFTAYKPTLEEQRQWRRKLLDALKTNKPALKPQQ